MSRAPTGARPPPARPVRFRLVRGAALTLAAAALLLPVGDARSQAPVCPLATLAQPRPEGTEQFVVVGQPRPCPPPNRTKQDFAVRTGFGDGTVADTPFREEDPLWFVGGMHTYRRAGTYQLVGTATDRRTGEQLVLRRTIEIPNAPLTARAHPRPAFTTGQRRRVEIGRFRDGNPLAEAGDHTATVAWGDGSRSRGTVVRRGRDFSVLATHRYRRARSRVVTVVVRDDREGKLRMRVRVAVRR